MRVSLSVIWGSKSSFRFVPARRCSPACHPELAAVCTGDSRREGWESSGGGKEATYLENEGCPDDVVHPECHIGQDSLIIFKRVVSCHENMAPAVEDVGEWRDVRVAARCLRRRRVWR